MKRIYLKISEHEKLKGHLCIFFTCQKTLNKNDDDIDSAHIFYVLSIWIYIFCIGLWTILALGNFDICNTSDNTEFDMVIFERTRKREIVLYFHVIQILIEKVPVNTVNDRPGIILPTAEWGKFNVYTSLGVLPL